MQYILKFNIKFGFMLLKCWQIKGEDNSINLLFQRNNEKVIKLFETFSFMQKQFIIALEAEAHTYTLYFLLKSN